MGSVVSECLVGDSNILQKDRSCDWFRVVIGHDFGCKEADGQHLNSLGGYAFWLLEYVHSKLSRKTSWRPDFIPTRQKPGHPTDATTDIRNTFLKSLFECIPVC